MSQKLKIRDLVIYYVDRYHLDTSRTADSAENMSDGLGTYITAVRRIMEKIEIGEKRLWDVIKPQNQSRQISIEDFERYCLTQWVQYIEVNCENFDKNAIAEDKERGVLFADSERWDKKAEEAIAAHNQAMENDDDSNYGIEDFPPAIDENEVRKIGEKMMLEAIYNVFYESFNWNLLKYDLEKEKVTNTGYNPDIDGATLKSKHRLKFWNSYVGKKKQH